MTWYPQNAPWLITSVGFNRRKCLSSFYPSKDNWSILMLKLPYQVIPLDRVFRRPIKRTHVDFQNCQIRTTTLFEVIDLSPSSRDLIFFFIFIFFFSSWFLLYTWRCKGRRSSGRFTCVRRVQISFFDSFRMDGHRQFIFWHSDRSGIAVRSRSRIWSNTFTGEITVTIPHIAFHWLLKWIITTLKKNFIFLFYFFFLYSFSGWANRDFGHWWKAGSSWLSCCARTRPMRASASSRPVSPSALPAVQVIHFISFPTQKSSCRFRVMQWTSSITACLLQRWFA